MIDVVTNELKEGTLQEILHADDLVLMAETMAELHKKCYGWKSALDCKGLKVNLVKTRVMVSKIEQVTVRPSNKNDPYGICGRRAMVDVVLCKSCGNWIRGRCAKMKRVTNRFAIDFKCTKCNGSHKNIDQKGKFNDDDVETVTDFSYLSDRLNSGCGCEEAVTSRTRLGYWRNS